MVTAIANVSMNLIMVQFWGIYGVLLSTVLSMMFVGMPWLSHNLFTTLFDRSQLRPYLGHLIKYTITAVVAKKYCLKVIYDLVMYAENI